MDWFRSWHGAPVDLKWPIIARHANVILGIKNPCDGVTVTDVTAVTWALLDFSSQNSPRGSVTRFNVEAYSFYSGLSELAVAAIMAALHDKIVLENNAFVNWDKHQGKDDDGSAERTRRWRERQKTSPVTAVTVTETKNRTEQNRIDISTSSDDVVEEGASFEHLWISWKPFEMVKGNKQQAKKSFLKVMKSGISFSQAILPAAISYCVICHKKKIKTQHLVTWLNQCGWETPNDTAPVSPPPAAPPPPQHLDYGGLEKNG